MMLLVMWLVAYRPKKHFVALESRILGNDKDGIWWAYIGVLNWAKSVTITFYPVVELLGFSWSKMWYDQCRYWGIYATMWR